MHPPLTTPSPTRTHTPANPSAVFDELRTRSLLAGDPEQVALALTLIHQHLRRTLSLWLVRRLPRLTPDDLADVWADTLLAVLKAARRGRFRADRSLLPWLCRIVYLRGVDHLRRRNSWEHFLLHRPKPIQAHTDTPFFEQNEKAADLRNLLDGFVRTLPTMQSVVLAVFLEHWPDSYATAVLHCKVMEHTGQATTPAAVKRALQVARRKLRRFLLETGDELAVHGDVLPCAPALLMRETESRCAES